MRFLLQIVISTLVFLGISDSIYFATQLLETCFETAF